MASHQPRSPPPLMNVAKYSPERARLVECASHLTTANVLTAAVADGLTVTLNAIAATKKQE